MKNLTLGQLREALYAAEEKLKHDPENKTLRRAAEKLKENVTLRSVGKEVVHD